jgi:hypothetical protein
MMCEKKEMSMESPVFTPGEILKILFLYTDEKPSCRANHYLYCDRSLVYKWMRDSVILPKMHISNIVRFTTEHTLPSQCQEIRRRLETLVSSASLSPETVSQLAKTEDFAEYLNEVLSHSITLSQMEQLNNKSMKGQSALVELYTKTVVQLIIFGFLAAITGGVIWTLINQIFNLSFYMGGSQNEPTGLLSILWGVLVNLPIIVFALLATRTTQTTGLLSIRKKVLAIALYSLLGGLAAFLFYNSGFRSLIEGLHLPIGAQELLIAAVYAFILSVLPLLAFLIFLPEKRISVSTIPIGALFCSFAVSLSVLGTMLIGRPELEVSQLRGFVVALVLRTCLFALSYLILSERIRSLRPLIKKALDFSK